MRYILDPEQLLIALNRYPSVLQSLSLLKPTRVRAHFFPRARVEERLIYGLLAASDSYLHIHELLSDLDFCLANGCKQPTLIRTRARKQLSSAVAELLVAAHFLRRGFGVETFDEGKGNGSVPDVLVSTRLPVLAIEVYQPRDWDGLELFQDDLRNHLRHLDVPWDFYSRIDFSEYHVFDPDTKQLLAFDHWGFSDRFADDRKRDHAVEGICAALSASLTKNRSLPQKTFSVPELNAKIQVKLLHVRSSEGIVPRRAASILGPGYVGDDTSHHLFERLVTGRLQTKLSEGQAAASGVKCLKALFVDIARLSYADDFSIPYFAREFKRILDELLDLRTYDSVVFFRRMIGQEMDFPMARHTNEDVGKRMKELLHPRAS